MVTRLDAAAQIAIAVETDGYTASAWAPEGESGPVRVYVTIPAANWKKKARKIGFVSVEKDGTFTSNLEIQSGRIMGLLPSLEVSSVISRPAISAKPEIPQDEDVRQFEASQRATAAAESAREDR
jgi:hypothetical protein